MRSNQPNPVYSLILGCIIGLAVAWPVQRSAAQIVANHIVVDEFDNIPQAYLDEVKKMWVILAGESHSSGYRIGARLLAQQYPAFAIKTRESGTPDPYTDQHLRLSRASWGDLNNASGWIYNYGEEDWFTGPRAVERTKAHLTYCNTNNLEIAAMGFGWCWDMTGTNWPAGTPDPVYQVRWAGRTEYGPQGNKRWGLDDEDFELTGNTINMDTYLNTTSDYDDYCAQNGYATRIFFTTGPVDANENLNENGYQRFLKHERIRNYVNSDSRRILFDYGDILCYNNNGDRHEVTWTDYGNTLQTFQAIHPDNMIDLDGNYREDGDHIGEIGAVRLAKAMWWMLARMAGWDGSTVGINAIEIPANPTIYPNPVSDYVFLETEKQWKNARYQLLDMNARIHQSGTANGTQLKLDINDLSKGVYVLRIEDEGIEYNHKLIKI